jgi:alanyl-tRNA synthetase
MTSREIRRSFLGYFEARGHRRVPSSPLVPADDPTLLFTNAGMNQFKDVFLGRERRDYTRATSSQKCMRVSGKHNDLDNVGPSLRHHTFFEMLGNFSFGDYFKADAIPYAWELLTEVWKVPADQLYVTVFKGDRDVPRDDEAHEIWRQFVPAERIGELGLDDNFWQMGDTGPCGRCSEIHFHAGDHLPCSHAVCSGMACDCERYIEIWNNVFMEFDRQPDGTLAPLPARSIDTGMGLERISAVLQGTQSNYDTDLFQPILRAIGGIARRQYGTDAATDVSMRVVADHIRAMTFLIADGVVPSKEWRGYVLRKIMRRAMRHGKKLGIARPFLHELTTVVIDEMREAYPELETGRATVVRVIRAEEDQFDAVLASGLSRLEDVLDHTAASSATAVPGEEAFRLYDSLGLPLDFIEDMASERQLAVDREGFDRAMTAQRERGRAGGSFDQRQSAGVTLSDGRKQEIEAIPDRFEGYETTVVDEARVVALFDAQLREVRRLASGDPGYALLDRTPFYLEAGGQVSDTGTIVADDARAVVDGMVRLLPTGPRAHKLTVSSGALEVGGPVRAEVDADRRAAIRRNHTATHLLHAALRQSLGSHVAQKGSLVAPDRLRFDFLHFSPLTREELARIERVVNDEIVRNLTVSTTVRPTEEAIAAGAMALFGEKYGDAVRVVEIPGFSVELCGGTHCAATGDIGLFMITSEGGVSAGVRRIEALTGGAAVAQEQAERARLAELLDGLKVSPDRAVEAVARLQNEVRRLGRELQQARVKAALGSGPQQADDGARDVAGVRFIARRVAEVDRTGLRELADRLKGGLGSGVVVLATEQDGKASFVVSVTKDLTSRLRAGAIVNEIAPIVGGRGGGRPDFAEAGGKNADRIDDLLAASARVVQQMLEESKGQA